LLLMYVTFLKRSPISIVMLSFVITKDSLGNHETLTTNELGIGTRKIT
jgi:hypothetical protein